MLTTAVARLWQPPRAEVVVAEVYVDSVLQNIREPEGTVGDLLQILDARATAARHLVTDLRLDGVDEPAFREPSVELRPLAAIRRVEVTTCTQAALVRRCSADAASAAADISARALELAAGFRRHDLQAGTAGLIELSECLRTFVRFVHALTQSPGWDAEASPDAEFTQLGEWLGSLLGAHAHQDWLSVADVLEYDLAPAIARCGQSLRSLAA